MPTAGTPKTKAQICAEIAAGTYCGHIGTDNQWQLDALTILCDLADGATAPVSTVDTEMVCNADTGLWEYHQITSIDGVPQGSPVITATTISCDAAAPTFMTVRECRSNFVNIVTYQIDSTGTQTEVMAVPTLEPCGQDPDDQFEMVRQCRNGFIEVVTYRITSTGAQTELSSILTTEPCGPPATVPQMECFVVCAEVDGEYQKVIYYLDKLAPAAPTVYYQPDGYTPLAVAPTVFDYTGKMCCPTTPENLLTGCNGEGLQCADGTYLTY